MAIPEPHMPPVDRKAQLESRKLFSDLKHSIELDNVAHIITIVLLIIVVIIIVGIGVCRLLHLVLNEDLRWLSDDQLFKIDEFFIHGTFGALIVEFLRNKISRKEK